MTFREIAIYADGVNERREAEWKDKVTIAWLTTKLTRVPLAAKRGDPDPYPSLESLFPKPAMTRKQKATQLKERLAALERRQNKRAKRKPKKSKNG